MRLCFRITSVYSTTSTTTAEPTCNVDVFYTNSTRDTFAEELGEYFLDNAATCTDCNTAATSAVSTWPQLPPCSPGLPNFVNLIADALSKEVIGVGLNAAKTFLCTWRGVAIDGPYEGFAGCPVCDDKPCQTLVADILGDLNTWDTSSLTNLDSAFSSGDFAGSPIYDGMLFFNEVSPILRVFQLRGCLLPY